MRVTHIPSLKADAMSEAEYTWPEFITMLRAIPPASRKEACGLIKLGTFGTTRTALGSLRHDANVLTVTGIELDHDAGTLDPESAAMLLQAYDVQSLVVTTATHTEESPRWRVFCPFSSDQPIEQRRHIAGKLNALLGDCLAGESFILSQSFYIGPVQGVPQRFIEVAGVPCDKNDDLLSLTGVYPPEPTGGDWGTLDLEDAPDEAEDDALIQRALASSDRKDDTNKRAVASFGGSVDPDKWTFRKVWEGEAEGDQSEIDLSLAQRLAFWTGKRAGWIHRLMWKSGLVRDKWDREDYLARTITKALDRCTETYQPKRKGRPPSTTLAEVQSRMPAPDAPLEGEVLPNQPEIELALMDGDKLTTAFACAVMLNNAIKVRFNEFGKCVEIESYVPWSQKDTRNTAWSDADTHGALVWLDSLRINPPKQSVEIGAGYLAQRNSYHPVRDYLGGITWDGVPRIDTMGHNYFGTIDGEWERVAFKRTMLGAVARIFEPGCQLDTLLILEGGQGVFKSTALKALFSPKLYAGSLPDLSKPVDAAIQLNGSWCIEIAEFDEFYKASTGAVKRFITQGTDKYRAPYDRIASEHPRQSIMIASMNPNGNGYLRDPTGARRFWPVKCVRADTDRIRADRDQLWAEAVHRYKAGEQWHLTDYERDVLAIPEQDARREGDTWLAVVGDYLEGPDVDASQGVPMVDIFTKALMIGYEKQNAAMTKRAAGVMSDLGWTRKRFQSEPGKPWRYIKNT